MDSDGLISVNACDVTVNDVFGLMVTFVVLKLMICFSGIEFNFWNSNQAHSQLLAMHFKVSGARFQYCSTVYRVSLLPEQTLLLVMLLLINIT